MEELVRAAMEARENAYAPYSGFAVGAAVRDAAGHTHVGVNVENVSFGLTTCAERNAVARAIVEGARDLVAIAIVSEGERPLPPCGACRQVLLEFGSDLRVIMANTAGALEVRALSELLPSPFSVFEADEGP